MSHTSNRAAASNIAAEQSHETLHGGAARPASCWDMLCIWGCAIALALASWWPLVTGHGLIGGDIYTYYFPLKAWYADRLRQGELALWNPLIGNGAPTLGESQTGVFYPFNLLLYRLLPLNTAYNASFIIHYVLAFAFTGLYVRRLGLGLAGALLAGVVFVYGWFPARSCLEWAIVTGAWMPLVLWGVESYLDRPRARYWIVTALALGIQLLAGHFNLAFITLLAVAVYAPLRCVTLQTPALESLRRLTGLALGLGLGVGIAALQLVPSWELKNRSQRAEPGFRGHDLGYGSIPAWYLPQVVMPWKFYPAVQAGLLNERFGADYTNKVEAHLYFGMLPLVLAVVAGVRSLGGNGRASIVRIWLLLSALGLAMVTGWWTGLLGSLPGFGYFAGPGRYGLLAQLGVAVAAACGLSQLSLWVRRAAWRWILAAVVLVVGWVDLRWASESVQYAGPVEHPPIELREQSPIARRLRTTDRVLSKNQNSVTLCGAAMLPVYLGIGPAEYYRPPTKLPDTFHWETPLNDEIFDWLRHAGVTHVLALESHPDWPLELVWMGHDPMLHRLLGPLRLYRLPHALGRAYWIPIERPASSAAPPAAQTKTEHPIDDVVVTANRVEIRVDLPVAARVVLTDLDYPGWQVTVDREAARGETHHAMYRSVWLGPGPHTIVWRYRPRSLLWGSVTSIASVVVMLLIGVTRWCAEKTPPSALGETAGPEQRRGQDASAGRPQ